MKSIDLWHKAYISSADSDSTSNNSSILLTLNTIETALQLNLNDNPSTSLIDDILLPAFTFKTTHIHSKEITPSLILSNVNRYKCSFQFADSIQNKTDELDQVFTTFNTCALQTKDASISCILRDINSMNTVNILLLYKNYQFSDYILYEPQSRLEHKLNGPHFLLFKNQNLLSQYVKSIFCDKDTSNQYIADFVEYISTNTPLISKDIDYNAFNKDLKAIGLKKVESKADIITYKEQQELIDLYDEDRELWRNKIRNIIHMNWDQFHKMVANGSECTQAFLCLGLNNVLIEYIFKDIEQHNNDNNMTKITQDKDKTTPILRWINDNENSLSESPIAKDWLYDELDRSAFHAFFELYDATDTFVNICDAIFDIIDVNKDGTISLIEWFTWQYEFKKKDLYKLFNANYAINEVNNENEIDFIPKSNDTAQCVYDQYIQQYGYAPKEAKHLMHFSNRNGSKLMFVECKNIIIANKIDIKSMDDGKENEPIIDLTDKKVLLEFANTVRNLTASRRQRIWRQNVHINNIVHSQTKSDQHIDDILLFLIIIYAKEKYPTEEDVFTSKLKEFVLSSPFRDIKTYFHSNQFPLLQDEFISNNNYFALMIEEYANNGILNGLGMLKRAHTLPHKLNMYINNDEEFMISNVDVFDDVLYNKLENKIMDLFGNKIKEIEYKINNLSKEMQLMKYAMIESEKSNDIDNTNDIMDEIKNIKTDVEKLMTIQKNTNNNNDNVENIDETNAEIDELREWIGNECELPEYVNTLIKHGVYSLDLLQVSTIIDLALLGISKFPDRVKIMQQIQKLKYEKQMLLQQETHTKSM